MNIRPEQLKLIKQWVEKAEEDFRTAEYLLVLKEDCPLNSVCFHSQQCAEKYIKALLMYCSIQFPKSHDVVELLNLVPDNYRPDLSIDDLAIINRYAVDTRYPQCWEIITRQEAEESVTIAKDVRQKIRMLLGRTITGR
jgi:HEPN domain-containing protein